MLHRWRDPATFSSFLADPSAAPAARPSRRQSIALIAVLVVVAAGAAAVSWLLKPTRAQAFDLLHGSIYINDVRSPVSVDLASGKPTVRLLNANQEVDAADASMLQVVPLTDGTLLLNSATGEFNMVDSTGFVIKLNRGVTLPARPGRSSAQGVAAGEKAYIVRSGSGRTDVYLVGRATVQAAADNGRPDPRGFRTINDDLAPGPGSLASANGDLWMITGAGADHTLWHLSLPPGSNNGVTLTVDSFTRTSGLSAVGVATAKSDGSGGDVAAVAYADHIDLTEPDGSTHTVHFPTIAGLDRLLPATNQQGRAAFLYHGSAGWGLVSVGADGTGLWGPHPLAGVDPGAALVVPAASNGALYTMDTASGDLFSIDRDAAATPLDPNTYPLNPSEPPSFGSAYVIARGARVIFDSPDNVYALTVFTDHSHAAQLIDKNAATSVNAAGGAAALAATHAQPQHGDKPGTKPGQPKSTPAAQPPAIDNNLDCTKTTQVPHIPVFTEVDPGSRSVQLQWSYPKLDTQDCIPSTYEISVELISADAPKPPSTVIVNHQDGVNLTGLFPSTQYRLTLTAVINNRGTSSAPILVTTGPEGPAAPTAVRVSAAAGGDWTVSWHSCGGVQQGCVPAQSWDVLPRFCDNRGLSTTPAPLNIIGDPTLHTFTATYPGGGALLGRSMAFQIQGEGDQGTKGTPSAQSACSQSWGQPVAGNLALTPSKPADTTVGGSTSVTVTVDLGTDAQTNVGGLGATVTFQLAGPGGTQTKGPMTYDGTADSLSATFSGLPAGAQYTATAVVAPPGHPQSAVTLGPADVATRADWPAGLGVTASCPPNSGLIKLTCELGVQITGLRSSDANGEAFDLASGQLVCDQRSLAITQNGFDPAQPLNPQSVSLLEYHGSCTVSLSLVEDPSDNRPLVFGGVVSPVVSTTVDLGSPSTLDASQSDFQASWNSHGGSTVFLQYTGSTSDSDVARLTDTWAEAISAPDGTACGTDNQQPTSEGVYIAPTARCVDQYGNQTSWTITVSYDDAGTSTQHSFTYTLAGTPPGYQACTPSGFAAAWAADGSPAVDVSYGGSPDSIAGCSNWAYTLQDQNQAACGTPDGASDPTTTTVIKVGCQTPPAAGWTVLVTYDDTAGSSQSLVVNVDGTPP